MDISTLNHLICIQKPTLEIFSARFTSNHEQAEQLVQDTIIQCLQDSSSFAEGGNLKSWLYSIMKSIYLASSPEPLIQVQPFGKKKILSKDEIQIGCSALRVDRTDLLIQVNQNLHKAIRNYAKDLRDFERSNTSSVA